MDSNLATAPVWAPIVGPAPHRDLCTDCGVSRSTEPKRCAKACQFIRPDYPALEARVHGRTRDPQRADELHFGPHRRVSRTALKPAPAGAQWTGITPLALPSGCSRPAPSMRC